MSFDCSTATPGEAQNLCRHLQNQFIELAKKYDEELDEMHLQIYIISGVFGAVALVLIFITIALATLLHRLRQTTTTGNSDMKPKPTPERGGGLSTKTGQSGNTSNMGSAYPRHQPPHSYVHSPKTPAEEELAQLGFSAYTGEQSRGLHTSPSVAGSTGGVRVLPRNPPPPTGFRNGAYNDGF